MKDSATHAAIEAVARHSSYGRLIAYLASRAHDVAGAEDALSDAFAAALERWPLDGIPQKREAWLLHAARIASAFLVSPAAMRQRLVRAKAKIRDAAIPFRVPGPREWDERVSFVLDAIYSAYTTGWESLMETGSTHHALAEEATAIGRTLIQLMPAEPEAHGLLALMLHCEARRAARYTSGGRFVPLDQQDTCLLYTSRCV